MSGPPGASEPAPRRESTDFSIERILSKDNVFPTSSVPLPAHTRGSLLETSAFLGQSKLDWLRNFSSRSTSSGSQIRNNELDGNAESSILVNQNGYTNSTSFNGEELSWLRCTRYRPPKLPRKSSIKHLKRKPGSHPRIPFTKYQLEILEDKYRSSAYLSRKDVATLSELLQLPQSRIKIWFQNRRARERRESQALDQSQATRL